MSKTHTPVNDGLYQYILDYGTREPELLRELRDRTAQLSEHAAMQISADQGQFLGFLVKLLDAKHILEVGTFTGYSSLAMAMATPAQIICCDVNREWTDIAREYWARAGIEDKITLRLAPALDTLRDLQREALEHFDFIFIDADKENYCLYYDLTLSLLKPGGVLAIDNVFWGGSVVDKQCNDLETTTIRALSEKIRQDKDVDISMIAVGDGIMLVRKH